MKDFRPRLKGNKLKAFNNITKDETRVLVIGDLHEPFCLDEYLAHCQEVYAKYNCNKVIFIGDVIDNPLFKLSRDRCRWSWWRCRVRHCDIQIAKMVQSVSEWQM